MGTECSKEGHLHPVATRRSDSVKQAYSSRRVIATRRQIANPLGPALKKETSHDSSQSQLTEESLMENERQLQNALSGEFQAHSVRRHGLGSDSHPLGAVTEPSEQVPNVPMKQRAVSSTTSSVDSSHANNARKPPRGRDGKPRRGKVHTVRARRHTSHSDSSGERRSTTSSSDVSTGSRMDSANSPSAFVSRPETSELCPPTLDAFSTSESHSASLSQGLDKDQHSNFDADLAGREASKFGIVSSLAGVPTPRQSVMTGSNQEVQELTNSTVPFDGPLQDDSSPPLLPKVHPPENLPLKQGTLGEGSSHSLHGLLSLVSETDHSEGTDAGSLTKPSTRQLGSGTHQGLGRMRRSTTTTITTATGAGGGGGGGGRSQSSSFTSAGSTSTTHRMSSLGHPRTRRQSNKPVAGLLSFAVTSNTSATGATGGSRSGGGGGGEGNCSTTVVVPKLSPPKVDHGTKKGHSLTVESSGDDFDALKSSQASDTPSLESGASDSGVRKWSTMTADKLSDITEAELFWQLRWCGLLSRMSVGRGAIMKDAKKVILRGFLKWIKVNRLLRQLKLQKTKTPASPNVSQPPQLPSLLAVNGTSPNNETLTSTDSTSAPSTVVGTNDTSVNKDSTPIPSEAVEGLGTALATQQLNTSCTTVLQVQECCEAFIQQVITKLMVATAPFSNPAFKASMSSPSTSSPQVTPNSDFNSLVLDKKDVVLKRDESTGTFISTIRGSNSLDSQAIGGGSTWSITTTAKGQASAPSGSSSWSADGVQRAEMLLMHAIGSLELPELRQQKTSLLDHVNKFQQQMEGAYALQRRLSNNVAASPATTGGMMRPSQLFQVAPSMFLARDGGSTDPAVLRSKGISALVCGLKELRAIQQKANRAKSAAGSQNSSKSSNNSKVAMPDQPVEFCNYEEVRSITLRLPVFELPKHEDTTPIPKVKVRVGTGDFASGVLARVEIAGGSEQDGNAFDLEPQPSKRLVILALDFENAGDDMARQQHWQSSQGTHRMPKSDSASKKGSPGLIEALEHPPEMSFNVCHLLPAVIAFIHDVYVKRNGNVAVHSGGNAACPGAALVVSYFSYMLEVQALASIISEVEQQQLNTQFLVTKPPWQPQLSHACAGTPTTTGFSVLHSVAINYYQYATAYHMLRKCEASTEALPRKALASTSDPNVDGPSINLEERLNVIPLAVSMVVDAVPSARPGEALCYGLLKAHAPWIALNAFEREGTMTSTH